jgi:hypothetical protein
MSRNMLLLSLAAACCMAMAAPRSEAAGAALAEVEEATEAAAGEVTGRLQQRLRSLEERVLQLQQQSRLDQEALEQGRRRQAELEVASHALPWLLGLLVALAAVAVGLAWRVQALSQKRRDVWWDTSAPLELDAPREEVEAPVTAAVVFNEPALPDPTRRVAMPLLSAVLPVDEQIALSLQVARLLTQAQDDKAVELLQSRLESGARTPWLLLKLLMLYQRSGQRAAFDRLARQVAVRFSCTVPVWDAPPPPGLEGEPQLLQQLQQAWESPVDALQMLGRLLLQPRALPSLAACEDLLLLYRVAHERHRQELSAEIDLPLPLVADEGRPAQPLPAVSGRVALQPAP